MTSNLLFFIARYYRFLLINISATFISWPLFAQVCPSPVVVVNTSCEVANTPITVTPANAIGLNSSGSLGEIIANNIIENLGAATTTGALAQSGSKITFTGSIIATTATTTATASGQIGLRATGSGSKITSTGSSITLGPSNGTTTANNLTGARAENGGALVFSNTVINILGGASGLNNVGVLSTGLGSEINYQGGTISTMSRASFGVLAQDGGTVNLEGTQITTTGSGAAAVAGSHALYALGTGSQISGTNVNLNVSGNFTNAVRAEGNGSISLNNSTINSSGTSSADTDPASAVRALSGGQIQLSGSTITATGQRGNGFSVQDVGSSITMTNTNITVSGTRAKAGFVFDGGSATLINSKLLSLNTDALVVQGTGSTISLLDTDIKSTAILGLGLRINTGASGTMTNGSSITTGRDSPAVVVINGTFSANNATFQTSGNDNAIAVLADQGGVVTLNGGSVTTSGDAVRVSSFPHATAARNPGGKLFLYGTTILTTGYTAMGSVADDGGTVSLWDNSIKTYGDKGIGLFSVTEQVGTQFSANIIGSNLVVETFGIKAHGVDAQARNDIAVEKASAQLDNSQITTHGNQSVGLLAMLANYGTLPINGRGEGAVITNRSTVLTEGTSSYGAFSLDNPTSVTMNFTSILTKGAFAHGAVAAEGGAIIGLNSTVKTTGSLGAALFLSGNPNAVSTGDFTNSTLVNSSGATISIAGLGNATLTNSSAYGSGQWLFVGVSADFPPLLSIDPIFGIPDPDNPDAPPLSPSATLTAPIITPGLANVSLSASTVIGSAFTASGSISNVTMNNNSLWSMTGNSNITNLYNNSSLIQYTPPNGDPTQLSSYKTLTTENYVGNNGAIGLNTFLGADPSPSDILLINGGTATGDTSLFITNTTGRGALTIANGILVVDTINGATTSINAFKLSNPGGYVAAGPYAYTLFRSSRDTTNPEAWYLRSTLSCPPGSSDPLCSGPNPEDKPNFRPEVSLYSALPSMALFFGQTLLDTLHERVGDEEDLKYGERINRPWSGTWGRIIGQHGQNDGDRLGIYGTGPEFNYNLGAIQIGHDFYRGESNDGSRNHIGLYGAGGHLTGDVTHVTTQQSAGDDTLTNYSIGGYWTHFGPSGWYLDGILQGSWYDAKGASLYLPALQTDGEGVAASLEGGYPFAYKKNTIIEPQAQLIYEEIGFDDASDNAATVKFQNINSVIGRLGVRFAQTWQWDESIDYKRLIGWVRPNFWHNFKGSPQTLFSYEGGYLPFSSEIGGSWLGINLGADAKISQTISIFANATYENRITGTNSYAYNGKLGVRTAW